MSESLSLRVALRRRDDAEKLIEMALKRDYKPGMSVAWERNGMHFGAVVMNGYGDKIKVRNRNTGKEFWIYAAAIKE